LQAKALAIKMPMNPFTSASNFLRHVDAGHYDGAAFYRANHIKEGKGISVVQGGLAAEAITGAEDVVQRYTAIASGSSYNSRSDQGPVANRAVVIERAYRIE
jgi:hypothetical protein